MAQLNISYNLTDDKIGTQEARATNFRLIDVGDVLQTRWQIFYKPSPLSDPPLIDLITSASGNRRSPTILLSSVSELDILLPLRAYLKIRLKFKQFNGIWTDWSQIIEFKSRDLSNTLSVELATQFSSAIVHNITDNTTSDEELLMPSITSDSVFTAYEGSINTYIFDAHNTGETFEWNIDQPAHGTFTIVSQDLSELDVEYVPDRYFTGSDSAVIHYTTTAGTADYTVNLTVTALASWPDSDDGVDSTASNDNFIESNNWDDCPNKCYYDVAYQINKTVSVGAGVPVASDSQNFLIELGVVETPPYNTYGYLHNRADGLLGTYTTSTDVKTTASILFYPQESPYYEDTVSLVASPVEGSSNPATRYNMNVVGNTSVKKEIANVLYNIALTRKSTFPYSHIQWLYIDNVQYSPSNSFVLGRRNPAITDDIFDPQNPSHFIYDVDTPWSDWIEYLTILRQKLHSINLKLFSNLTASITVAPASQIVSDMDDFADATDGWSIESVFHTRDRINQTWVQQEISIYRSYLDKTNKTLCFLPNLIPFNPRSTTLASVGSGSFSGTYKYVYIWTDKASSDPTRRTNYSRHLTDSSFNSEATITVSSVTSVRISGWGTSAGTVDIYRTTNGGSTYKLVTSGLNASTNPTYDDHLADVSLGSNITQFYSASSADYYQFYEEYFAAGMSMMFRANGDSLFVGRTVNSISNRTSPQWYDLPTTLGSPTAAYTVSGTSPNLIFSRTFTGGTISVDITKSRNLSTYKSSISIV